MKKIIPLLMTLLLAGWSFNAWSFACKTAAGVTIPIGGERLREPRAGGQRRAEPGRGSFDTDFLS